MQVQRTGLHVKFLVGGFGQIEHTEALLGGIAHAQSFVKFPSEIAFVTFSADSSVTPTQNMYDSTKYVI